jgi:CelD/BcsL family acetyltransferase involved in cellulose biosynthesis
LRRRFWVYVPKPPSPRRIVELPGSFEDYLAKFSPRTRSNFRNKVNKLEKACDGQLELERVETRAEVPSFLDRVDALSRRSWQGALLQQVVTATEAERERLQLFADRGWLRGYLLKRGNEPLAFAVGYQADGTYFYARPGYDPSWGHLRVGTVLLYKIIEDLTRHHPARRLDFGYGDNDYKEIFANHSYPEANVYLVRRSTYGACTLGTIRSLTAVSSAVRGALDRLRLRETVRHWLRRKAGS